MNFPESQSYLAAVASLEAPSSIERAAAIRLLQRMATTSEHTMAEEAAQSVVDFLRGDTLKRAGNSIATADGLAAAEALRQIAPGRTINLLGAWLPAANLAGARFANIGLKKANLRAVNLSGSDLSDADLREVNLSEADLGNATLCRADLSGAYLEGANLAGADMRDAIVVSTIGDEALDYSNIRHLPADWLSREPDWILKGRKNFLGDLGDDGFT